MRRVTLSLVSHTNVGKTTLARTLLRRDVGEVLDQAHVTDASESYTLISTAEGELRLWDTPGFGDSVRLLKRLRRYANPIVWFVQQTWDRVTDRPLWSSQQAALNIRDEADVVLYLVNATEEPEEAGYVPPELELLGWIGRPILLLLNQTGSDDRPEARGERIDAWRRRVQPWPVVRDVLALDAFSRCWVQESLLLERIVDLLPAEQQPLMARLESAWTERNLAVFERAVEAMARFLHAAAVDREGLARLRPDRAEKRRGMEALAERLERGAAALMASLLELHGLEGTAAAEIDRQLDAFAVSGEDLMNPEKGAFWGGVVSGAAGGLTADIMSGGLSFGGGLLAGAILGALGGAGLARGFRLIKGNRFPEVTWAPLFLARLLEQIVLRYLAVAHFGRGRGEFHDEQTSQRWQSLVGRALGSRSEAWEAVMREAGKTDDSAGAGRLERLLDEILRAVLAEAYPEAAGLLCQAVD